MNVILSWHIYHVCAASSLLVETITSRIKHTANYQTNDSTKITISVALITITDINTEEKKYSWN